MTPAIVLHGLFAAFWLGSLFPLGAALRSLPLRDASVVVDRFSRIAVVAVTGIVLAGIVLAWIQVAAIDALAQTRYGLIFVLKLGAVTIVLAIAILNKSAHSVALAAGDERARTALARNIRIEIGVIALIVALTASLGFTTPPRAVLAAEAHDHHDHHDHGQHDHGHGHAALETSIETPGGTARITVDPGHAGHNTVTVRLADPAGAALEPLEVAIRFSLPTLGIEPVERKMTDAGDGLFRLEGSDLSVPGPWTMRIDALVTDFEQRSFEGRLEIR